MRFGPDTAFLTTKPRIIGCPREGVIDKLRIFGEEQSRQHRWGVSQERQRA
jgi:hypothetical protein